MKFTMVVKQGPKELAKFETQGDKEAALVTMEDVNKVVETEQYLERLFNLRFHIHMIP